MPTPNPGTRYHILGGGKITTLASGIDASALSFTVNDASGWPGVAGPGAFWIVADAFTPTEEKMLCTSRTGNAITVTTRGVDGTAAVAHTANTGNWYPVIAAGIIDPVNEHVASTSAVHGVAGAVVGTTDTQTMSAKTLNTSTINSPTVSGTVAGAATYTTPTLSVPVIADHTSAQHTHLTAAQGGALGTSITLTTPTIADFTNATHNHSNAAGGGATLTSPTITSPTISGTVAGSPTFSGSVTLAGNGTFEDTVAGNAVAFARVNTDTVQRWVMNTDGKMEWGPGGAVARDTNLFRDAASVLRTNDSLTVDGDLSVGGIGAELRAIKTSTESVTSSTVLQNDDQLLLALPINNVYRIDGEVFYDGDTAADIKIGFTGPAGAVLSLRLIGIHFTVTDFTEQRMPAYTAFGGSESFGALGTGTDVALGISGIVSMGGTAGNFQLQWAQNASNATATRVFARSHLIARRIS